MGSGSTVSVGQLPLKLRRPEGSIVLCIRGVPEHDFRAFQDPERVLRCGGHRHQRDLPVGPECRKHPGHEPSTAPCDCMHNSQQGGKEKRGHAVLVISNCNQSIKVLLVQTIYSLTHLGLFEAHKIIVAYSRFMGPPSAHQGVRLEI